MKAKLVSVTFITRIVVNDDSSDENTFQLAKPRLKEMAKEEMFENLEKIEDDTECPYGSLSGEDGSFPPPNPQPSGNSEKLIVGHHYLFGEDENLVLEFVKRESGTIYFKQVSGESHFISEGDLIPFIEKGFNYPREMPRPEVDTEKIAREFSRILLEWVGEKNMKTIIDQNFDEENNSICHSHDFTDANMAMEQALVNNGYLEEDIIKNGKVIDIWDAAWTMAKENEFYLDVLPPKEATDLEKIMQIKGVGVKVAESLLSYCGSYEALAKEARALCNFVMGGSLLRIPKVSAGIVSHIVNHFKKTT